MEVSAANKALFETKFKNEFLEEKLPNIVGMKLSQKETMDVYNENKIVMPTTTKPTLRVLSGFGATLAAAEDIDVGVIEFEPTLRMYWKWNMNLNQMKTKFGDIGSELAKDVKRAAGQEVDKAIFALHGEAAITLDDGSLANNTNTGTGSAIILDQSSTDEQVKDYLDTLSTVFLDNNIAQDEAVFMVVNSTTYVRLKAYARDVLRATMQEELFTTGKLVQIDGFFIYTSNNLVTDGAPGSQVTHCIAGVGKPFYTVGDETPTMMIGDMANNADFKSLHKALLVYGVFLKDPTDLIEILIAA